MWMPLVLRKTTNNPQSRFSAPVTQEWRQDWHRILLVAHSCYRSLSRRSPAPLCHLTEPPVASNSCALSLFLEGGSGDELSHNLPTWTTHCNRGLFWALLQFSAVCPDQQACTLPALYSKEDNRSGKVVNIDNRERWETKGVWLWSSGGSWWEVWERKGSRWQAAVGSILLFPKQCKQGCMSWFFARKIEVNFYHAFDSSLILKIALKTEK